MAEIVTTNAAQVVDLYKQMGKSEKQLESLTFEVQETPLIGQIYELDEKPKKYQNNQYLVYKVQDKNGRHIGEISVNRNFDSEVIQDDIQIVQSETPNKGKAMLRNHRLSNTAKFGKSKADQIAGLIGTIYVAERKKVYQPKDYTKICVGTKGQYLNKSENDVTNAHKNALWNNTQINEKAMKIAYFDSWDDIPE